MDKQSNKNEERTEKMRRKNINWKRTRRNKGADVHNTGIKNDVNNWICIFYAVFFFVVVEICHANTLRWNFRKKKTTQLELLIKE